MGWLDDVDVLASDRLKDLKVTGERAHLHVDLAVVELVDLDLPERDVEVIGHPWG